MSTINFNNIRNNAQLRLGKISNKSSDIVHNEFIPIINAVEIDWNGAEVEENKVINTTGDLLAWIKESNNSNEFTKEQIESLEDAINIISLIKSYFINKQNLNIYDPSKYYWYIGVNNPSSVSNIQTSNTVPGWHEIGSSLSGFVLNTDTNVIDLGTSTRVKYNVIIPEELHIYAADGTTNVESIYFNSIESHIQGYKVFKVIPSEYYPEGEWDVCGIIIK